jgi:hypothetical protein
MLLAKEDFLNMPTVHKPAQAYTPTKREREKKINWLGYLPEKVNASLPFPDSKCIHMDHSFLLIYVSSNSVKVEEYVNLK